MARVGGVQGKPFPDGKVQKRDGSVQQFDGGKVARGAMKAGATAEEASKLTDRIIKGLMDCQNCPDSWQTNRMIASKDLSDMVVSSLEEINEEASKNFEDYRKEKYRKENDWEKP
jgi:hypothetical protein